MKEKPEKPKKKPTGLWVKIKYEPSPEIKQKMIHFDILKEKLDNPGKN